MGFDVLYLPPIHPIGETFRKGKNNKVSAEPDDVGSPWAIGGAEGGHKAMHPQLGTIDDFERLVDEGAGRTASRWRMDIAFQASPDHPYVKEHPRLVPDAARRHDPVRGESAEEVSGHLSVPLRERRVAGAVGRAARRLRVLGRQGRAHRSASTIRTPSRCRSGSGASAI